ncbi:MAG: choice-of-anchor U domain-containing protein, partial [Planctomycetota bacterium]|nr:choice-of-anchor U domain-containing protein [Planctomycetota bacterium]
TMATYSGGGNPADSDGDYQNGETYFGAVTANYAGDGVLPYRFLFHDGVLTTDVVADPTEPIPWYEQAAFIGGRASGEPAGSLDGLVDPVCILTHPGGVPSIALDWTGVVPFVDTGVSPTDGSTGDTFEFAVMYTQNANEAPVSAQVWIDTDDNGTFEQDEMFDLVWDVAGGDGDFTNGEVFGATLALDMVSDVDGDGFIRYRFVLEDSASQARWPLPDDGLIGITIVDSDADGVPDAVEDVGVDFDGDGITDDLDADTAAFISPADGVSPIVIAGDDEVDGDHIDAVADTIVFTSVEGMSQGDPRISPVGMPTDTFPHGFVAFTLGGLAPGQGVRVWLELPAVVPTHARCWKFNRRTSSWHVITLGSNDGDAVVYVDLLEGDVVHDSDLAAGTLTDPIGVGTPLAGAGGAGGGGGSGGGGICVLSSAPCGFGWPHAVAGMLVIAFCALSVRRLRVRR